MTHDRAITWRSVCIGLAGVVFICALTPYNDYALNNTFLVGNNLPLGAVMLAFLFAVCINGPLSKWKPHRAFSSGEIAVAFAMVLVSCALPSSGLMRYFPASLIIPFRDAGESQEFRALLEQWNLPHWLFPKFSGSTPREWVTDPVITGFIGRWTGKGAPPYLAWLVPAVTWGIFLAALYGALMFIVVLVRRQWFENERLAFPLAQIELALVESPRKGNWFNDVLRQRVFWIAFFGVFLLHGWNGMARYDPQHFVRIPVSYDLWSLFSDPPWTYVDTKIKDAAVFFTALGAAYFLPSSIAFSLWFFYILWNGERMLLGMFQGDPTPYGQPDEHFGSVIAFAGSIFWIGRKHFAMVLRQAFRGERSGEPRGRYLSYRFAFWGLIACIIVMVGFLVLAGCELHAAVVTILLLLLLFLVITRIIAETGLVHGQLRVALVEPWRMFSGAGWGMAINPKSFFLCHILQTVQLDMREPMPVYASHALKLADQTVFERKDATALEGEAPAEPKVDPQIAQISQIGTRALSESAQSAKSVDHSLKIGSAGASPSKETASSNERRTGRRIIALLALSLLVGYLTSFSSMLWTEYRYASTQDISAQTPINEWGAQTNPGYLSGATVQYKRQTFYSPTSVAGHFTFGFAFTCLLAFLRLRFSWWPLHPIGYLMLDTFPAAHLWFSIFLGWLAKLLIVRFTGSRGYANAKPFFIGLIVGESAAAGFWLASGIVMNWLNIPYNPINIMPG
jgi:hypothetical protein